MAEDGFGFGEVWDIFKSMVTSGPANAVGTIAKYGTKIGMFFGLTSPGIKNAMDFAKAMQTYLESGMKDEDKRDLANRGIQDLSNWTIAGYLEGRGWSPKMATICAGIASKVIGIVAGIIHVDGLISGAVDKAASMVTGGVDTLKASLQSVGTKLHGGERTANT